MNLNPSIEESSKSIWQEWRQLTELTNSIPQQFQYGLTTTPLKLTSISALPDGLVIGTNAGLLYFVHLPSYNLMRLKCENVSSSLTTVSSIRSVDDMIASGCISGFIYIFQLPIICDSQLRGSFLETAKPPKRFSVKIHACQITCLHWSRNSMKLFSGDDEGNVGLIDLNYENCTCTGRLIFKLDSRIVQLSYSKKVLAASCLEKCFLFDIGENKLIPVGKKTRNPPGLYGCTFASSIDSPPTREVLYCARPGRKIWSAGLDGIVLYSYIHQKFPLDSQIQLLRTNCNKDPSSESVSFGYFHRVQDSVILSHSSNSIVILDVKLQKILGHSCDFTDLNDVTVCDSNIFILESHRVIRCISICEPTFGEAKLKQSSLYDSQYLEALTDLVPNKQFMQSLAKIGESVVSKISNITNPKIISGEKHIPTAAGVNSDQSTSQDSPTKSDTKNSIPEVDFSNCDIQECFETDSTSLDENSDILVLNTNLKKKPNLKHTSNESDDDDAIKSVLSLPTDEILIPDWKDVARPANTSSDIKSNIEENEKYLADILNLSCLMMDHQDKNDSDQLLKQENNDPSLSVDVCFKCGQNCEGNCSSLFVERESRKTSETTPPSSFEHSECYLPSPKQYSQVSLSYGPPSGSSSVPFPSRESFKSEDSLAVFSAFENIHEEKSFSSSENLSGNWTKHFIPAKMSSLIGLSDARFCFVDKCNIYFSSTLTEDSVLMWAKRTLPFEVTDLSPALSGFLILGTNKHLYHLETEDLFHQADILPTHLLEDTCCAAVDQSIIWTLNSKHSCVAIQKSSDGLSERKIVISDNDFSIRNLICGEGIVWALTIHGAIILRIGVSKSCPMGMTWNIMETGDNRCLHISNFCLGWRVDSHKQIFFKPMVKKEHPQGMDRIWWQICQSDFMMTSDRILIASTSKYLWVADQNSDVVFSHDLGFLTGHHWEKVVGDMVWSSVKGEAVFQNHGLLYCCDLKGQLFSFSPTTTSVIPIELPENERVFVISSRPQSLWVLTHSCKILIREGLSAYSSLGTGWVQLDMTDLVDVRFVHVSLGMDVVWAVEEGGSVYMRQGPLGPPNKRGLSPGWLCLDSNDPAEENIHFSKIFTGNTFYLVWGIDTNHRIYVREAIFPELSTGTSWVLVPGLKATSIAISEDRVFVLTPSGIVFEREGVSVMNYVGESWQKIPYPKWFHLADITVSVDNRLWGLSVESELWKHSSQDFIEGNVTPSIGDAVGDNDPEDWEIL